MFDLAAAPTILVVSYVGTKAHRPVWTGMGQLLLCVGTFLFVLPHFLTDTYIPTGDGEDFFLCSVNNTEIDRCKSEDLDSGLQSYLALFLVARILHGIGAEPLLTLAVTYLDDCVTRDTFAIYMCK